MRNVGPGSNRQDFLGELPIMSLTASSSYLVLEEEKSIKKFLILSEEQEANWSAIDFIKFVKF